MTKLEMLKLAVSGVVGIGTTKIVHGIISSNVEVETTVDKVTVTSASFVVGSMAADATKSHTDKMIDDLAANINKALNREDPNN